MKNTFFALLGLTLLFPSCIGDDYLLDNIDPVIRITSNPGTLEIGTEFQFEFMYLNNVGAEETVSATWSTSDPSVLDITPSGNATALTEGTAVITVTYDDGTNILSDAEVINVGTEPVQTNQSTTGSIATTSSYLLTGSFEFKEIDNGVSLTFGSDYQASTALPGLYVYLSNNQNSVANAFEIGMVETFSGSHQYNIPGVGFSDYQYIVYFCKPFNVKVGDGTINN